MLRPILIAGLTAAITFAPSALAAPGRDSDRDGMPNRWETKHRLNPKANDSSRDKDKDGLDNLGEYQSKTNPRKKDSDRDGIGDAREDRDHDGVENRTERHHGLDPSKRDSDDDGVEDGHSSAGSIVSFDGTTLVIATLDGTQLSGTVNASTEIECKQETAVRASRDDDREDDSDSASTAGDSDDDKERCTTAALVGGAPVHEAEIENGIFHSVHLNDD